MTIGEEIYNQLQFESGYRILSESEVNTMVRLEREQSKTSRDIIYAVHGTDTDRDYLLGYVTCENIQDIHTLFDDRKGYGLKIEPIKVYNIDPKETAYLKELKEKKRLAEAQINGINEELRKMGIKT